MDYVSPFMFETTDDDKASYEIDIHHINILAGKMLGVTCLKHDDMQKYPVVGRKTDAIGSEHSSGSPV